MTNIKERVIEELQRKDFPDLKFLYSDEVLDIALELLWELLEEEKKDFENKLKIKNEDISFETFEEDSELSLFWWLLNHLQSVKSWDKVRDIIEEFEPKLTEFSNEISYSKRYFEMLDYCLQSVKLDEEQEKIISDSVRAYKVRWINLEKEKQDEIKKINLELSELSNKFSNILLVDSIIILFDISKEILFLFLLKWPSPKIIPSKKDKLSFILLGIFVILEGPVLAFILKYRLVLSRMLWLV